MLALAEDAGKLIHGNKGQAIKSNALDISPIARRAHALTPPTADGKKLQT